MNPVPHSPDVRIESGHGRQPPLRLLLACLMGCLLGLPSGAYAELGPATTARKWCEKQTLHYLQKHGYQPYNWTATTYIEGDSYITKGIWRVDVDELQVECTSKKSGKRGGGRYKILNIDVSEDDEPAPRRKAR